MPRPTTLTYLVVIAVFAPYVASAGTLLGFLGDAEPETILKTYILISTAAVGFIAAALVVRTGLSMQGGVIGKALVTTGGGMVLIAASYFLQGYTGMDPIIVQSVASILFLSGFALIGVSSGTIRKAISS